LRLGAVAAQWLLDEDSDAPAPRRMCQEGMLMVGCHDARGVDLPTSQGGQGIVDGVRAMARGKRACAVEIGDDDQSGAGAGWLGPINE